MMGKGRSMSGGKVTARGFHGFRRRAIGRRGENDRKGFEG